MKKSTVVFCFLSILLFLNPLAFGQAKSEISKSKADSKKIKWNPSIGTFEYTEKLPKSYDGMSGKLIIDWISSHVPEKKGEYEKQADFDEKRQSVESELVGKVYAFKLRKKGEGNFDQMRYENYDADSESYVSYKYPIVGDGMNIITEIKYKNLGKYAASNAFGKVVQVDTFLNEDYGVFVDKTQLQNSGLFRRQSSGMYFMDRLYVPIEKAKKIFSFDIDFLFVGKIKSTKISKSTYCIKPKMEIPLDGCTISYRVFLSVDKIITYHYDTGEILSQVNIAE